MFHSAWRAHLVIPSVVAAGYRRRGPTLVAIGTVEAAAAEDFVTGAGLSSSSRVASPPTAAAHTRVMRLGFIAGTVALGASYLHPIMGPASWVGTALFAAGLSLSRTGRLRHALLWIVAFQTLHLVIGFPWLLRMIELSFPDQGLGPSALMTVGFYLLMSLPPSLCIGVTYAALRRWDVAHWWLGPAWGVGEWLRVSLTQTSITDWLVSQWGVTPMMRLLGHAGWWPTLVMGIFASAALGRYLTTRRWRWALAPMVLAGVCLLLPERDARTEHLTGVAAMHTHSTLAMPHTAALQPSTTLLIWPEAALHVLPTLGEVRAPGARIHAPLPGSQVEHLLGLETLVPSVGRFNQAVAVRADGRVIASRAKRLLFPGTERRFFGVGRDQFIVGTAPAVLTVGERQIIAAVCGEYLTRDFVAAGQRLGGELLAILARDGMFPGELALRQLLGVQVLRSVEFHVPSVRASLTGRASIVDANGRVLAVSSRGRNGLLTWQAARGAGDVDFHGEPLADGPPHPSARPGPQPDVAVLYSKKRPRFRTRCPEGRCSYHELESFRCAGAKAKTVIIAGHAAPPTYLSHAAEDVAAAARCFEPELVVVDTCYGASSPLLNALSGLDAVFVGAPTLLPPSGFSYAVGFFADTPPMVRARAVHSSPGAPVLRWRINADLLATQLARVATMDKAELNRRLARRVPPQIRVELGEAGEMLVPVAWKRLRQP
ncbi:MAG: hypothetical protein KC502_17545 [Myxococcales bacterium]|nr:hypothetical protein [Myxococcales bacterium]